jgi:hypothetical protein
VGVSIMVNAPREYLGETKVIPCAILRARKSVLYHVLGMG